MQAVSDIDYTGIRVGTQFIWTIAAHGNYVPSSQLDSG